jgi:hypothetical protein
MYFAYQPLSGDGSIVARITGVANANVWSRAGVMIRETMSAGSANAYMFLSAGKTLAFQRRLVSNGSTFATLGAANIAAPRWVRLDRSGNTFTAYQSTNGVTGPTSAATRSRWRRTCSSASAARASTRRRRRRRPTTTSR